MNLLERCIKDYENKKVFVCESMDRESDEFYCWCIISRAYTHVLYSLETYKEIVQDPQLELVKWMPNVNSGATTDEECEDLYPAVLNSYYMDKTLYRKFKATVIAHQIRTGVVSENCKEDVTVSSETLESVFDLPAGSIIEYGVSQKLLTHLIVADMENGKSEVLIDHLTGRLVTLGLENGEWGSQVALRLYDIEESTDDKNGVTIGIFYYIGAVLEALQKKGDITNTYVATKKVSRLKTQRLTQDRKKPIEKRRVMFETQCYELKATKLTKLAPQQPIQPVQHPCTPVQPHPPSTPREITVSFDVKGHWRDQPCGPGRMKMKRVWIESYAKCEDKPKAQTRIETKVIV